MHSFKVAEGLWVGTLPSISEHLGRTFHRLVITAEEYIPGPGDFPGVSVMHVPLDQGDFPLGDRDRQRAIQAGRAVAGWAQRGMNVLVAGTLGMERSCMVTAVAMATLGHSAEDAVRAVRAARGEHALRNPHFLELVHEHGTPIVRRFFATVH